MDELHLNSAERVMAAQALRITADLCDREAIRAKKLLFYQLAACLEKQANAERALAEKLLEDL